jgi:hypothetical protein
MKHSLFLALFCLFITTSCFGQQRTEQPPCLYAIAFLPTPVLNTPDFSFVFGNKDGKTLHLDDAGLMREVEFIALPETIFTIEKTINQGPITLYKYYSLQNNHCGLPLSYKQRLFY